MKSPVYKVAKLANNPSTFGRLLSPVFPGNKSCVDPDVNQHWFSTSSEEVSHGLSGGGESPIESHHQKWTLPSLCAFLIRATDRLQFLAVHGERFLNEHGLSMFESFDYVVSMTLVSSGDKDGVHVGVTYYFSWSLSPRKAEISARGFRCDTGRASYRLQGNFCRLEIRKEVSASKSPGADATKTQLSGTPLDRNWLRQCGRLFFSGGVRDDCGIDFSGAQGRICLVGFVYGISVFQ